jgi:hypothetical protein
MQILDNGLLFLSGIAIVMDLIGYAIPEATRRIEKAGTEVYRSFEAYQAYLKFVIINERTKSSLAQANLGARMNFDIETERVEKTFAPYVENSGVKLFLEWLERYKSRT